MSLAERLKFTIKMMSTPGWVGYNTPNLTVFRHEATGKTVSVPRGRWNLESIVDITLGYAFAVMAPWWGELIVATIAHAVDGGDRASRFTGGMILSHVVGHPFMSAGGLTIAEEAYGQPVLMPGFRIGLPLLLPWFGIGGVVWPGLFAPGMLGSGMEGIPSTSIGFLGRGSWFLGGFAVGVGAGYLLADT